MNLSQWISEKLNLVKPYLPRLTPAQINQLAIGLGAIFTLYVLFRIWKWRKNRARTLAAAPKMRPRNAEAGKSKPVAPPPAASSPATAGTASTVSKETGPEQRAAGTQTAASVLDIPPSDRKFIAGSFWPEEPKLLEKKNLFDDVGEEYPWADGSDYTFGSATPILSELLPTSDSGKKTLTKSLRNAGYYQPHAWQNLSAVRYLGIILPLIFFGAMLVVVPEFLEPYMIAGLVIGPALGWALPALYVRSRAAERLREIENAMPDMLDLLNMCVSQGMTVPVALRRVGRDIAPVYPALSKELTIVADQARVGHLTEALGNFSDRVDTPEVHSFSSLLIQTEQMGTSVSEALNEYSDNMRESQKQRADEKANAATFKLLFPTVLCLMPAVFLFLMGPPLIELNKFFSNGGLDGLDRGANAALQNQRVDETP